MASQITISIQGQIVSCTTNIATDLFCKFVFISGPEWSIISGPEEGISQRARTDINKVCIWNYPIDVVFQGPKPFGWPQLVVAVYGLNLFGQETVVGYGAIHIPPQPGHHEVNLALFDRAPSSIGAKLKSWFSGDMPESIPLSTIATGDNREILRTESGGFVKVSLDIVLTGFKKFDLLS